MSLARAIEYHVNVFVEHSMSSSPSTLATLKISRRNLAEAAAMAIGAKSIRQSPAVTDSKTALVGRLMQRAQGISRAEAMRATGWSRVVLPRAAKHCGLDAQRQLVQGVVRYFA
jgi:hypothetical protein